MCGEVGHTSHGIALHFDVRAEHLANERLKTTKLHNQKLIVG